MLGLALARPWTEGPTLGQLVALHFSRSQGWGLGSLRPLFLPLSHGTAPAIAFPFHSPSLGASGLQGRGLGKAGAAARGSLRSEQGRWGVSGEGC